MHLTRGATLIICISLAACAGGSGSGFAPSFGAQSASQKHVVRTDDTGTPGESAGALPGEGAGALPGAQLPCSFSAASGQANCTIAIDVNIPANPNSAASAASIPGLNPTDLQRLYALPSGNAGLTVAVVDAFDDPTAESDIGVYRSTYGLPACTTANGCFRKVNETGANGPYPPADVNWSQEIALDLEMVSAACPRCTLLLVEANSASIDDLGAGVDEAATLGARAISNSYYASEWSGETSEDAHYRHRGIAITVSAGDQSAPFYPAASPYVTSVGGTSVSGSPGGYTEKAWPYGGNGCSAYEPRPTFQSGVPCKTRATVDVAAVADPQTGVAVFSTESGGWIVAGGTSVGAPLLAGAYALTGQPQSNAYAYAHRSAFHDIPPAGYDLPTGLGTPNGIGGL